MKQFKESEIKKIRKLGEGGFGEVHEVEVATTSGPKSFALKLLVGDVKNLQGIVNEVKVGPTDGHPLHPVATIAL